MSVLKNFKNTPRSPPIGRHAISVNFFPSNLQRGPWPKKFFAPVFFARNLVANLKKKKLHLGPVAPHRATGGSFEIFQNGHIFLKF